MPHPPRVRDFDAAAKRAAAEPPSGLIAAIEDLVRMKRTRRPSDYETISRLVRVRLRRAGSPSASLWRWALLNTFDAEDLASYAQAAPTAAWRGVRRPAAVLLRRASGATTKARALLAQEMSTLQSKDAAYWRKRRAQLKRLRQRGELLPEGAPVASLLRGKRGRR